MTAVRKSEAKIRIQKALDEIPTLTGESLDSQVFQKWYRNTRLALQYVFGVDSSQVQEFNDISYSPIVVSDTAFASAYRSGLSQTEALLSSMYEEIDDYWDDEQSIKPSHQESDGSEREISRRIFVVHGRDEGTLQMVVRVIEKLELVPIVLKDQSNEGRTVIEKFEDYSDVGFAVALCTPDDAGALATEADNLRPRPRQNVVFEWGFFVGRLGRNRVCALTKNSVELPSDYAGVLYIDLDDAGAWQFLLCREFSSAGIEVDANKLV